MKKIKMKKRFGLNRQKSRGIVENGLSGTKAGFKAILNLVFNQKKERKKMDHQKSKSTFSAILLTLTLMVAALGVGLAIAAEKKYVTDPTTGKVVSAPEYGGTLTTGYASAVAAHSDSWWGHNFGLAEKNGVLEKPAIANWAIDRNEWAINSANTPTWGLRGALAESWETPDDTTIVLNIRKGVHWHDKAPMNGREFTADDMVYNYHRLLGLGSGFTEPSPAIGDLGHVGIESITASDKWTVVFKLERPHFFALSQILDYYSLWMYPPDVIKQDGDAKDWRNLVGTGPFMLTDYVEGSSLTFEKNPNYWGFDEKYPENRLPYVDKIISLLMQEEVTRLAALRSGKIDYLGYATGGGMIRTIDPVVSLAKTNPEIAQWPYLSRADFAFGVNVNKPPLNDIRVRKAMQMALDLETINDTIFHGRADTTPHGQVGESLKGWFIPFDEWPEEVKKGYMYDTEGAEKLLDEAGLPRGADGIRFKTSVILGPWNSIDYYELAAFYWSEIGVDLEIQVLPAAEWLAKGAKASFEVLRSGSSGMHYFGEGRVSVFYTGSPWNAAAVSDPDYDAMIDTLRATSDFEEYQRLFREADQYAIGKHWMIWGPDSPQYQLSQPWVKGYNGEAHMGNHQFSALFARIWIDQELKAAMGH